jgi:tetratricopeptide (TPR) repeat protein
MGEAGAGKTALVAEFARRATEAHGDLVVAIGNCNAQTGIGDPYLPFREILGQLTGDVDAKLAQGAITLENARRLQGLMRWSCDALVHFGPDLVNILVPGTLLVAKAGAFALDQVGWLDKLKKLVESKAAQPAGPALEQSHIFEQTTNVLKALAVERPLVLVLDDLQWADSASISLLFHLGRRIGESRILVLGAYRGEEVQLGRGGERHPLEKVLAESKRYYGAVWVDLDEAEKEEAQQFVNALLDLEPNRLGRSFRRALVQHTGGHPLFAVELLRNMQEQGDLKKDAEGCWIEGRSLDWDAMPPRVEGVIEERVDRLETELQETLTVGSVEGEEFTAEVIARVRAVDEGGLVRRLSHELDRQHHLVASQGIRRLGRQPLSSYRFRHSLFQKYLYLSLDAAERTYLHDDVGNALEGLYGDQAAEIAVQLGRHFEEAGLAVKAIHYLRLAAEGAMRVSANVEAIDHLTRALTLLQTLPDTAERDQLELPLQISLAAAMIIAYGGSFAGVQAILDRARELCRTAECSVQLIPVLRQLYFHHHMRAEHRMAYELAVKLLSLVQQTDDPVSLLIAHGALGQTQIQLGDIVAGRDTLERGLAYYDPERLRNLAYVYGEDFGVTASAYLGVALLLLGYPDQGLARMRTMLTVVEVSPHPHVLAIAFYGITFLYLLRRESHAAQAFAERGITLCEEKGIPFFRALLSINHAHALALQGHAREGIAEGQQALATYRSLGARLFVPYCLAQVAEMHFLAGQAEAGLAVVAEGLAAVDDTGEGKVEAELYRLRAELLASQGHEAEAEEDWHRALAVARRQQARSWELRATLGLCRLWCRQGKRADARRMLAEIYGWFTEGFDTPDLQEAKALLEELAENKSSN